MPFSFNPNTLTLTQLAKERNVLWLTIFKIMESLRDDYLPGEPFYAAFTKIIICHRMFQVYYRTGRGASASDLSRHTGVPRETVTRKLKELERQGIIEQQGLRRYVPHLPYFDTPEGFVRFEKRRAMLFEALGVRDKAKSA